MNTHFNTRLLLSDARNLSVKNHINPFQHEGEAINIKAAQAEHDAIREAFIKAGADIEQVPSPPDCQDGIYTANWAFVLDGTALMANLPYARRGEVEYAAEVYKNLGYSVSLAAQEVGLLFSGQGDMLFVPGTNTVFGGYGYRTDKRMHKIVEDTFSVNVVSLHAIPERDFFGYKNFRFGWPHVITEGNGQKLAQSPAYDLDLMIGILRPGTDTEKPLIAYAPSLMDHRSRKTMEELEGFDKIIVSRREALGAYGCNLVSIENDQGDYTVVVNENAMQLISDIEQHGLSVIPLPNNVISKGGGGFRCVSNTLNNQTSDR